jgi:hypothetical protein
LQRKVPRQLAVTIFVRAELRYKLELSEMRGISQTLQDQPNAFRFAMQWACRNDGWKSEFETHLNE